MDQLVVNFIHAATSLSLRRGIRLLGLLIETMWLLILILTIILTVVFQELAMFGVAHQNFILCLNGEHVLKVM